MSPLLWMELIFPYTTLNHSSSSVEVPVMVVEYFILVYYGVSNKKHSRGPCKCIADRIIVITIYE